jgi:hypothetical protein
MELSSITDASRSWKWMSLTVIITWRAASFGEPLNAVSTRVTLDLISSTKSSIILRKMSTNIQKVQKALQDLKEKNIA